MEEVQRASGKQPRRQLCRRDTDEATNRAIERHFRGVPKSCIETKLIDGLSLRQRIARDLRASRACGKARRLGTTYWRGLRDLYVDEPSLAELPVDKEAKVQTALKRAMEKLVLHATAARSSEPMQAFMRTTSSLNRKELLGLAAMVLKPQLFAQMCCWPWLALSSGWRCRRSWRTSSQCSPTTWTTPFALCGSLQSALAFTWIPGSRLGTSGERCAAGIFGAEGVWRPWRKVRENLWKTDPGLVVADYILNSSLRTDGLGKEPLAFCDMAKRA